MIGGVGVGEEEVGEGGEEVAVEGVGGEGVGEEDEGVQYEDGDKSISRACCMRAISEPSIHTMFVRA